MPWCPKCNMEYQDGITSCSDCNVDLVESLDEAEILVPFFQAEDQKLAEKLVRFFEYSDLKSELSYDEETELYIVSISPKQQTQAKKLYQAFYYVEASQAASEKEDSSSSDEAMETMDTDQESSENSEDYSQDSPSDDISSFDDKPQELAYVMKADQYKDLANTVWIFLLFGIAGCVVVVLNIMGVLSIFNGWIPISVMSALFLAFIYIALSTNQKAKKVQAEIDTENKLTEDINQWLKDHVTEEFLASIHNESLSDELNFINKNDTIKEMLVKEFGPQNLAYLDRLIDEYYSSTFDQE